MAPPVLLLDVMGTLVHDPFFVELPAFFGLSFEAMLKAKHPTAWVDFELGRIGHEQYAARFFADGRAVDAEGMRTAVEQAYRFLPGIEALLESLHATGLPMHTLSNYPCWYSLIERRLRLSRFVQWTFVSCDIGLRKPDPEVYRYATKTLGVSAERCIFVDDRDDNCRAARAVGMDAILFRDAHSLREALRRRGLLPTAAVDS